VNTALKPFRADLTGIQGRLVSTKSESSFIEDSN
jgi:hypothetical protein